MKNPRLFLAACLAFGIHCVVAQKAVLIKDIQTAQENNDYFIPKSISFIGDKLVFSYNDGVYGKELFSVENPENEPILIKDINLGGNDSDPRSFTKIGGKLFFCCDFK